MRPTSASPGSIAARARDVCPCQRPTRQDRPDRRAHARRVRARPAARPRAGFFACPQRLGATGAERRDQLVLMRAQEKNRRSEAGDRAMVERIGRLIEVLDHEIDEIEADISALIKAEPEISHDAQLMRSLPGVGPVASMQLIAQMPELGHVGPKQVAALAGLAPFNVDSGAYRGKRKIAGGRKRVRDALYMAALNADPPRRSLQGLLRTKLRQAGKPAKLALIAVARKLLIILNAMMRDSKSLHPGPTTHNSCRDLVRLGYASLHSPGTRELCISTSVCRLGRVLHETQRAGSCELGLAPTPALTPPSTRASSRCRPTAPDPARSRRHSPPASPAAASRRRRRCACGSPRRRARFAAPRSAAR